MVHKSCAKRGWMFRCMYAYTHECKPTNTCGIKLCCVFPVCIYKLLQKIVALQLYLHTHQLPCSCTATVLAVATGSVVALQLYLHTSLTIAAVPRKVGYVYELYRHTHILNKSFLEEICAACGQAPESVQQCYHMARQESVVARWSGQAGICCYFCFLLAMKHLQHLIGI